MNKETLDILIDALSEQEWQELKNRADVKKAFSKAGIFRAKTESAVQFGDWILKHTVYPGQDENMNECWFTRFGDEITYYTTLELYSIYISGGWDDMSDWDVTLNDGFEELDS
jgi:hypothetical protein